MCARRIIITTEVDEDMEQLLSVINNTLNEAEEEGNIDFAFNVCVDDADEED